MNTDSVNNRIKGLFWGLAAGDKIGGPTQMVLQLANTLQKDRSFVAENIAEAYQTWWLDRGFDTGRVANLVFRLKLSGLTTQQAVQEVDKQLNGLTAGCNPAHRAIPLAAARFLPHKHLSKYAFTEAKLTHQHDLAGDVSVAVVTLCRDLIEGADWDQALADARVNRMRETAAALKPLQQSELSRGGFAPDVLQAAVYFVQNGRDFEEALIRSIHFAGPSNYSPVLVGAIAGARWGYSSIPENLYAQNISLKPIEQVVQEFTNG